MRLDDDQLRELARLVAAHLGADALADTARLVTAAELACSLGVSRDTVYDHADELGAVRIGDGPKAALRFDPDLARQRLAVDRTPAVEPPRRPNRRRQPAAHAGQILAIRRTTSSERNTPR